MMVNAHPFRVTCHRELGKSTKIGPPLEAPKCGGAGGEWLPGPRNLTDLNVVVPSQHVFHNDSSKICWSMLDSAGRWSPSHGYPWIFGGI